MLRRIHADDHVHLADPVLRFDDPLLLLALEHDPEAVEEALRLLRDLADLVVADDGIEGVETFGLAVVQSLHLT